MNIRGRKNEFDRTRITTRAGLLLTFLLVSRLNAQTNDAVVYLDSSRQVISGFGAANIVPWRPDMTAGDIQNAFGTGTGQLGFSLLRLRIPYSETEFALNVPSAQAAVGMGAKVFASPWTPPAWMKTSNDIVGGHLHDTSYASYAAHLRSFYDYMLNNGVNLYAISIQNEPDIAVTYESCDWDSTQMVTFIKEHGPSVGTRIIAPESFQFRTAIANAILNDSAATANVSIIGGHIYGGGLAPYPLAASKGKEHWMTEHLVLDTTWTAVLGTGSEIQNCMNAGMNAYVWWYIVRYYGPIHEDGYVTKRGYVMSHFSRFIRPGFKRVMTYSPRGAVPMTAYVKGSRFVIVVVNGGPSVQQPIRVENFSVPLGSGTTVTVTPYVTSPTKNVVQGSTIDASSGSFVVTLDSSSITTMVGDIVTGVGDERYARPRTVELGQNYPNPFNPSTMIRFSIPSASHVSLTVFDLLGREVASLVRGELGAGEHTVEWAPQSASSGLYVYRLVADRTGDITNRSVKTRSMLLVR